MKLLLRVLSAVLLTTAIIPKCGSVPGVAKSLSVDIIATAAPTYNAHAALRGEERFPGGAQLMMIHEGKATRLVKEFAASADANVSFDGKSVLFAGKRAAADPWQVWELRLADGSVRRLIDGTTDAIKPLYLPSGQFVFALRTSSGFQLEVAGKSSFMTDALIGLDAGLDLLPISYMSANAIPADVLADGRILFEANYPLGSGSAPEMFLVYSDGSGIESYRCDHGRARWGGRQVASGDVVFTHGNGLARFTSPRAQEVAIVAPRGEFSGAIAEMASGEWVVSTRTAPKAHYVLKLFKPGLPQSGVASMQVFFDARDQDLVDPVLVAPRARPHHHPTALHPWDYANLLALDARMSREGDLKSLPASVRLETLDPQGHVVVTGTAPVEADGSFFVQTPADRPIRFALLNAQGTVVRQEHGWFWARKGEQRICAGCHTGPERASENHVPAALMRTTIPENLTGTNAEVRPQLPVPGGN